MYSVNIMKANPNILQIWFTGLLVPQIEIIPEELLIRGMNFVLDKFVGHLYNITKPEKIMR